MTCHCKNILCHIDRKLGLKEFEHDVFMDIEDTEIFVLDFAIFSFMDFAFFFHNLGHLMVIIMKAICFYPENFNVKMRSYLIADAHTVSDQIEE